MLLYYSAPIVLKQTGACQISNINNTLLRKLNIKLIQVHTLNYFKYCNHPRSFHTISTVNACTWICCVFIKGFVHGNVICSKLIAKPHLQNYSQHSVTLS